MQATADIAIVIPHFNDLERLCRCLDALFSSAGVDRTEIVVVDNDSPVDLSLMQRRYPAARFVVETARGAAAARNRGVQETVAPLLFFLDSDCVPSANWIETGREALRNADIVGGAVELFDETPPPRSGAQAFEIVFAFNQKRYVESKGFSVSANLLTWRHVFENVGGFRPGVSEDVDWCHRALRKKYRLVYDERVAVAHPTRRDMDELKRKWRRMVRESFALQSRRPFARLRWAARAGLVLCSPAVDFPRILLSGRLSNPTEVVRGTVALFQLRACRAGWMIRQVLSTGRRDEGPSLS